MIQNTSMRLCKWLLIVALSVQPFISCKKDGTQAKNKVHGLQTLPGAWELRYMYGGGTGLAVPEKTRSGNGYIKRFTDSVYWFANEDKVWDSGTYKLTTGINPETNVETDAMILHGDTLLPRYFQIADDTLTIYTGIVAADGTIEKYVRIYTPEDLVKMGD